MSKSFEKTYDPVAEEKAKMKEADLSANKISDEIFKTEGQRLGFMRKKRFQLSEEIERILEEMGITDKDKRNLVVLKIISRINPSKTESKPNLTSSYEGQSKKYFGAGRWIENSDPDKRDL